MPLRRFGALRRLSLLVLLFLSACGVSPRLTPVPSLRSPEVFPTATCTLTPLPTATVEGTLKLLETPSPAVTDPALTPANSSNKLPAERWQEWPVVPAISEHALSILREGAQNGNNPRAFSKIGDCETITEWFLGDFDKGNDSYNLGEYADLQAVIDYYQGSYGRLGVAAMRGFTAASVMNPYWRDVKQCDKNEAPLDCEIRLNHPSIALIMLGTNDVARPETFERNLRAVIEETISKKVLPILMTKADNLEGDQSLNLTTARLSVEYDIPLWNFWRAVQNLPDKGLQADKSHLTFAPNDFSNPDNMKSAWPVRNLTALQVLDEIRKASNP